MAKSRKILPKPTRRKTILERQKRIENNLEVLKKLSK